MKYPLPDWAYDIAKWAVTVFLPLFTAFYVGLADTWGWAMTEQIQQTLILTYTFLGGIMGISGGVAMVRERLEGSDE